MVKVLSKSAPAREFLAHSGVYEKFLRRAMVEPAPDSAVRFAKSGDPADVTIDPHACDAVLMADCERRRRPDESVEKCLARLASEGDAMINALFSASRQAQALLEKQAGDLAREGADERVAKREAVWQSKLKIAAASARAGETPEAAMGRLLLHGDQAMADLRRQHGAE